MLTENTAVIAETGDSWFNCQKLKLPEGCTYEFQMQYGSIGWAVGATLGYAQGTNKERRVIACIGDGSFQVRPLLHSFFYIERRSLLKALLQCIVNHFFSRYCALKMVMTSVVYHFLAICGNTLLITTGVLVPRFLLHIWGSQSKRPNHRP
jgi:TPP-dependent trihydroxycyclohexane-1,2-dione (THcHDO) dehydratase